jgi:hypothetical protein
MERSVGGTAVYIAVYVSVASQAPLKFLTE